MSKGDKALYRKMMNPDAPEPINVEPPRSLEERIKQSLCHRVVDFAEAGAYRFVEIAELSGLPKSRISEMMHGRISKFTVDQLLKNLTKLASHDERLREYLRLFENLASLPAMSLEETKKLAETIESATLRTADYSSAGISRERQ